MIQSMVIVISDIIRSAQPDIANSLARVEIFLNGEHIDSEMIPWDRLNESELLERGV